MNRLFAALAVLAGALAPQAARAEFIVGLTSNATGTANFLVTFDSATPGVATAPVTITGLSAGEQVVGIDYRPADGTLVAVTRQNTGADVGRGRVYTLNASTGAATLIYGAAGFRDDANNEVLLTETNLFNYGVDFNPVPNALRIVNTADQNLRITLGAATPATFVDTPLNGPTPGEDPNINAIAYTNNVAGATTTTLYALDGVVDRLRTIGGINGTPSPNLGQVLDVAALGPPNPQITNNIGFDISGDTGIAYVSFTPLGGVRSLYTVDLATGATTLLGAINFGAGFFQDFTVIPAAIPEPASVALLGLGAAGLVGYARRRRPTAA